MNKLDIEGPNPMLIGISSPYHLHQLLEKGKAIGREIPVAITIGLHPAILTVARDSKG